MTSSPHRRSMSEVIPMGNQVVYVCVDWCDHVGIFFQTFESINICRTLRVCGNLKNPCPINGGLIL